MAQTKIKAGQFSGIVSNGTDGYFLMTNGDGTMSWEEASTGPSVTSVTYPGDDTAADPAGGQTAVLTGTNFGNSMTVSIGGTTAPSVAHDSSTQLTITTPAKAAGDYDIVVTNTVTGASGTFVNGISYNGIPSWTTAAGSLGTFNSETTISTITLQATETDGGTITFNITNGALPSGLSLTGANIDGTTIAESSTTLYSFTIEAIDDENQATPRSFSITVNAAFVNTDAFDIVTYTGTGGTYSIGDGIEESVTINSGTANYARGSVSHSTGKRYFEVEYISANGNGNTLMVGIINTAYVESWANAQTKMYYAGNGNKYTGGSGTSYGATYAPGDIIGVAYDGTNRTVTFYKNNVSQGTAFTGLITNYPSYFPAIGTGLNSQTAQFRFTTSEFTYTPPSGYSEWGSATVSAHSGTINSAVAAQPIDFQPDLVWVKSRSGAFNNMLTDSINGGGNFLIANTTSALDSNSSAPTFDSNGFTLGAGNSNWNGTYTYVAWCWKAGGAAVSGSGTNVSSVTQSENADAGFGIYRFTTTSSDNTNITINHNLNATPEMVIAKETSGGGNWYIYHKLLGNNFYVQFNTNAKAFGSSAWGAGMTSSVIGARTAQSVDSGETHVAYAFHSVDGYQKVDSYTGSGSSGLEITTGFQPRFLMIKGVDSGTSDNWFIFDSERGIGKGILPNQSAAEFNNSNAYGITFGSDSFTLNFGSGTTQLNTNGNDYIYLAIA